jgi:rubrerythrin
MNPKGHSPVDLDSAEPATSRRGLLGAVGAAGLAGAAALLVARPVSAAPYVPTAGDRDLLDQAMRLEMTARDLYESALEAGIDGDIADTVRAIAANHRAYAQAISGATGLSANARNDDVFDELEASFAVSDVTAFAEAAMQLENTAVATHTELLGQYESIDAVTMTGSILVVEARHATVLADIAGLTGNLDDLLRPESEPLQLTGGDA